MRMQFTANAQEDLLEIARFIASESPARARSFSQELREACMALVHYPERFAVLPGYAHFGYRRRPLGHYSIIYGVAGDEVRIVRIVSSWIDLDAALDP